MKVLVTGAAGFIGSFVAQKLLERGDEVVGLDSVNDYYDRRLKLDRLELSGIDTATLYYGYATASGKYQAYRFVQLDITDGGPLVKLFADETFDTVCHFAAQAGVRYSLENPHSYIKSNVDGFLNILEACCRHQVKHLVYASSSSVYGANTKVPFAEDDRTDSPVSLYAATKKAGEEMAEAYSRLYGTAITGLRFFTVYGPWGRPDMAPMIFAKALTEGSPLKVYNYGSQSRDFTYIDDITEGVVRVLDKPLAGGRKHEIYNIGHGSPVSLMEFIGLLEREFGIKGKLEMLPAQPGDVCDTWADCSKLERDFGYRPQTSLDEGIGKFAEWYKKHKL